MDGSHCSTPDRVFGEATAVEMSAARSDHECNYKTDFEIWRENKEFEHQNILMSLPPFTPLLLIQTQQTQKLYIWTQLLLVQKHQNPSH